MKMRNLFFRLTFIFTFFTYVSCAQAPIDRPHCENPEFDQKVSKTIHFTVPTIGVEELKKIQNEVYIFDTRKQEEYDLSHIEGAQYLGFENFNVQRLGNLPKDSKIVLYCSIGYRSEKIGEKLKKRGYTNVHNLYGSIFEWVNQGYPVVNKQGKPTKKVHTYNKAWSKWVEEGKAEKIW